MLTFKLIIHLAEHRRELILHHHPVLVGRDHTCDVRLRDHNVSHRHCKFKIRDGHLTVKDLGSRKGTFVNDERILRQQPVVVGHGDEVRVGDATILVLVESKWDLPYDLLRHNEHCGNQSTVQEPLGTGPAWRVEVSENLTKPSFNEAPCTPPKRSLSPEEVHQRLTNTVMEIDTTSAAQNALRRLLTGHS